ncbi:helical backbone metal receptor [Raineyella sp. LH-20]|uniref:helical backbone metal receptor n=1 Tax=Raineyella sp. LH-20 TaxID=3081204 RepID=UPI002954E7CD|nr:helical backbone metal receptor [Raineyella sp. LH-20]WOP19967.1 helical backbone metal receptor [Raineyella sp. LH-20]
MTATVRTLLDDLGSPVRLPADGPRRIVSLVPSLTEALAVTVPDRLVGATDWCIRPADLRVARVRGTKNPDLAAIAALEPDLVVCNQEENRRLDVERLRERGIPVWVTVIESVEQAISSMRRLFVAGLGVGEPGWLVEAARAWEIGSVSGGPSAARPRVAIAIWRDPWMVVGSRTYTADLVDRLGFDNAFGEAVDRYPHVEVAAIRAAADLVVLPDEPYAFGPDDGPEMFRGGADAVPTVCLDGRAITWYGPAMVGARAYLEDVLGPWRG